MNSNFHQRVLKKIPIHNGNISKWRKCRCFRGSKIAKKANCKIIAIVNLITSSLVREADIVIGMNCGPEIGVAATKSFTSQLVVLYKIVQKLSNNKITIDFEKFSESILKILENPIKIQKIAKELKDISDIYIPWKRNKLSNCNRSCT